MLDLNFSIPTELRSLDKSLDEYIARLNLMTERCGLKHAPEGYGVEQPPAVDYLNQYLGNYKEGQASELLRIPICSECIEGLYDEEWALVYCVTCNSSQWIYKPDSSLKFNSDVVWLDECPICTNEKED